MGFPYTGDPFMARHRKETTAELPRPHWTTRVFFTVETQRLYLDLKSEIKFLFDVFHVSHCCQRSTGRGKMLYSQTTSRPSLKAMQRFLHFTKDHFKVFFKIELGEEWPWNSYLTIYFSILI